MQLTKLNMALSAILTASTLVLTGCGADGKDGINGVNGTDGIAGTDASSQVVSIERVGRTASQGFAVSAAEIVAFDKTNQRTLTVNAQSGKIDVFNTSDVTNPTLYSSVDLSQLLLDNNKVTATNLVGAANSVAIFGNLIAVAVEANPKTDNGWVVFLNASDLTYANAIQVGALPDMLTFTHDGAYVLVANEGEPTNADYSVDPEGSISLIKVSDNALTTLGFSDFNVGGSRHAELPASKMILDGYSTTGLAAVANSLEPEYIAVNDANTKAYVALQENNAIAVVDLTNKAIEKIVGLGFKDHSIPGNEMDASQKDGVNIKNWPVLGAYMPDSSASYTINGVDYLVTANEGDSREDWLNGVTDQTSCEAAGYYFDGGQCKDELALKDLSDSDLTIKAGSALVGLDTDNTLGRLKFSYFTTKQKTGGTEIQKIYAYGARSFSIWDMSTGTRVYDSGSEMERITANLYGADFNNDNDVNEGDGRSDNKGPEPEGLALGKVNGHDYAFVGLERMGGVMVYDISNPMSAQFVQYINPRDLTVEPDGTATTYTQDAGDLGPEGFKFVAASDSPNGKPLLIVGNEVSGTTSIYQVNSRLLSE